MPSCPHLKKCLKGLEVFCANTFLGEFSLSAIRSEHAVCQEHSFFVSLLCQQKCGMWLLWMCATRPRSWSGSFLPTSGDHRQLWGCIGALERLTQKVAGQGLTFTLRFPNSKIYKKHTSVSRCTARSHRRGAETGSSCCSVTAAPPPRVQEMRWDRGRAGAPLSCSAPGPKPAVATALSGTSCHHRSRPG